MIRSFSTPLVLLGAAVLCLPGARSQEPHHPEISIGHKGIEQLKSDIKLMLDLATTDERHWENWDGVIELFAFGLDYGKPIRVDLLSGLNPMPVMIYGAYQEPVDDLLHENLEGAEYVPQKISDTLYEMLPPDQGWFRVLPAEKYAILALSTPSDHNLLKQLILKAVNPLPVITEVLQNGASAGIQLVNTANTAEDQKKRRDSFAEIRAVQMDALQKRPQETQTEFELRKGLLSVNLDELERLMVESRITRAQAFLNTDDLTASIRFSDEAIPESSLADSIALFGQQKDAFVAIPKAEGAALSLRMNHPIDQLRQANTLTIIELIRNDIQTRLTDNDTMTAEQKQATEQLVDGIIAVVKDGVATGNVNAFLESVPNDEGRFVTHGAMSAKDARRLDETLALISKTGSGNEIDTSVETVNGVNIHRIRLKKGFLKIFDDVFGDDGQVYIGTADNMVWLGAGPDCLPPLKQAIESLQEPADSDVVFRVESDLLPWVRRAKKLVEALPEPTTLDDQQARRDHLLRLTHAVESMKEEDDQANFEMTVKDGTASGEFSFSTGSLRFIGKQLETFSRNNLE
ncbi:MAG: hypothetical protein RIK87_03265 [Fuerstiella sp.]